MPPKRHNGKHSADSNHNTDDLLQPVPGIPRSETNEKEVPERTKSKFPTTDAPGTGKSRIKDKPTPTPTDDLERTLRVENKDQDKHKQQQWGRPEPLEDLMEDDRDVEMFRFNAESVADIDNLKNLITNAVSEKKGKIEKISGELKIVRDPNRIPVKELCGDERPKIRVLPLGGGINRAFPCPRPTLPPGPTPFFMRIPLPESMKKCPEGTKKNTKKRCFNVKVKKIKVYL